MNIRFAVLMNIGLLAALFGFSAAVWPSLPERIPMHFGPDGAVDQWTDRSPLSWFAFPLLALGVTALVHWLARLLPARPELLNIPNKAAFLALPAERRERVIVAVRSALCWLLSVVVTMMGLIQLGSYMIAQEKDGRWLIVAGLVVGALLLPLSIAALLIRVQSRLRAQIGMAGEPADTRPR